MSCSKRDRKVLLSTICISLFVGSISNSLITRSLSQIEHKTNFENSKIRFSQVWVLVINLFFLFNTGQCFDPVQINWSEIKRGYIDVSDGCWARNMFVIIVRCWWRFLSPASTVFFTLASGTKLVPPTFKKYHQHRSEFNHQCPQIGTNITIVFQRQKIFVFTIKFSNF